MSVLAIGCGPFNLGLAALASTVDDVSVEVLEASRELRWHPGLMFDDATLQVSFLADLVTMVAPTHPLSFLAYLQDADRLYPFYVRERFHPTRREYEDYLRWAASRLPVRFSHRVSSVHWDGVGFVVSAVRGDGKDVTFHAHDLVLGIGTTPWIPPALQELPPERLLHSASYLDRVPSVGHVTVVGSGQSGAEVVLDLLRRNAPGVSWLTRSPVFAPLDYTKLVLEMTTPGYVRHFHSLPQSTRDSLVAEQWRHYKAISSETIEELHDLLYRRELTDLNDVELRQGTAVTAAGVSSHKVVLTCTHRDTGRLFEHTTDLVVAATGYRQREPVFLQPIEHLIKRDSLGRFVVGLDHSIDLDPSVTGRIFVANADLHSHGVAAPDLGIGAVRNAAILNAITGREVYPLPKRTAFTSFGAPEGSNVE
ncbi:lysine 6-monooxygenase [Lentzea sp. NBRC 105346]|uniref:lysine N(6)-hydroxylase/L-ornithine N(5)-oxygenase family protein n=1 Tax=Lentzea sp. NBRC 105346 TaxID=3032205 RepID=UPI0024A0284B|nr:SidA/IucD/PvdA family monooxygenase [Lentzea sp. NBRC 105346]GLZ36110.1 lysine 6-monooxygenase [Lentzea sp. NBRC 105346]